MSEWAATDTVTLQRRLRGAELLINYAEQLQDGNYQLTFSTSISTNLSAGQLERRLHAAWFRVRQVHPVVGVSLVSPEGALSHAAFHALQTAEEAARWAEQTCTIVGDGRSVQDVTHACKQHALSLPGKQAALYLISAPRIGPMGFVLNCSHVLSGHHALQVLETIAAEIAKDECDRGLSHNFRREELHITRDRLPISSARAYEDKFPPADRDPDEAWRIQTAAAERYTRKTIGVPVRADWQERPSKMHNLALNMDTTEIGPILASLKRHKLTLTSAFYACICSAIAQAHATGHEEGAHLLFSAHARRWVPTEGEGGMPPVTMAIVPGGAWISADKEELCAKDQAGLISLAHKIAVAQDVDLASPHVLGIMDGLADAALAAPPQPPGPPAFCRPTFTSQGAVTMQPDYHGGQGSDTWLRIVDFDYGGRNTDPSLCFAAHLFRRQFRTHILFDERFFDLAETARLSQHVSSLFRLFSQPSANSARL